MNEEDMINQDQGEEAFGDIESQSVPTSSWTDFAAKRQQVQMDADYDENLKRFNELNELQLRAQADARKQEAMRNADLASIAIMTRRNGGFLNPAVLPALSNRLGVSIGGANLDKDGNLVVYTRDQRTNKLSPIAILDEAQQLASLQKSKLGQDLWQGLYDNVSKRMTASQLESVGLRNPSKVISTGGVTMNGAAANALLGRPQKRSTISVYSTTSGVSRTKRPGEDWQIDYMADWRRKELADEEANRQADIAGAKRKGSGTLTLDERLQLEDRKDKRQEAAISAREKSEGGKHEIQLRQMFNRRKKSAEDNIAKYEKELRGAKKKIGKLEEPMYSDEEIQQKLDERANSLVASIREDFGEFANSFANEGGSIPTRQAAPKKVDNTKSEVKTVTGYRYSKDRTKRIPVYSDGTQGEIEIVN